MKKLYILLTCIIATWQLSAQAPANNNCSGAINIPVGTPPPCGTGVQQSTLSTVVGNITNATPGNPYIYQSGCSGAGGPNQAITANDVWYSFVATGFQASITINSSFANPNLAFYSGNCTNLGGGIGGCAVGAGGTTTLIVNQMIPGTTYYLQVSGNVGQVGTFTLGIRNLRDCQDCLQTTTLTVNPLPVNGAYAPGTTVNFCLHIGAYKTINTNWLHGVQLTFGSGWNPASIVPNVPVGISAAGSWSFYPTGIGVQNAINWGRGWYYDFTPLDGNPRNNFGDSNGGAIDTSTPGQWNFCVALTTNIACTPGSNLSVTFNTSGDGESGSWSNAGCSGDSPVNFNAVGACCPPNMSALPANCFASNTGSATSTPIGAAGPYTYNWTGPSGFTASTSGVVGANSINNVVAGIYTVTIVDNNLCAVSSTVNVTQPTSLTAIPSFTNASCTTNGSVSVSVSGGTGAYTYTWTPSGGNASSASVPQGTYNVTIQDANLCTRVASVTVGFTGSVSAAFTTPTYTQCINGNSFTFNASNLSGTHSYSFNPVSGGVPVGNTAIYGPVSFTAPGTYSVVHTFTSGLCSVSATSVIVVNPMPIAIANNNGPVCPGGNLVLSASGGTSYAWSGPNGFTSVVQNPTLTPFTSLNVGIYTVTVNALGCTSTQTTTVNIVTPTTSAANTSPYCAGNTIQLSTPLATSYAWSGPNGFTSVQQNPNILNSTGAMAGVYSVTVSVGSCTATATTTVTINALPTPTISSNTPLCAGQNLVLNGSGGITYQWSGPSAFSNATSSPTLNNVTVANAGTYTLLVSNANSCTNIAVHNVVVNPLPNPVVGSNGPVCINTSIQLTATGGTSYSWSGPNGFTSLLQNPSINPAAIANAGVYTVTVTALGCTSTQTTTVNVLTPTTSAANTSPYCAGNTIQLSTPLATSYAWSGPNSFTSVQQNPNILNSTGAMAGVYSVTVSVGSCTAAALTTVTIHALPTPSISSNTPLCAGQNLVLNGSGGITYQWSGPSAFSNATSSPNLNNVTVANAGTYTLLVSNANSCTNTAVHNVVVNPLPNPVVGSNGPVCINTSIQLTATGGTSYSWSGPNGFTSLLQNPSINPAATANAGVYTVTVTALGCTSIGTNTLVVNNPTTSAANTSPYCAGNTIQLTTPTGVNYSWSGPNGFTSALQNPSIALATVTMAGTYSVVVTIGTCTTLATTNVTVHPLPQPIITSNAPVCLGRDLIVNGTGGNTYQWNGPSLFSSASQNFTVNAATPVNAGVYTLTVTDINSCTNFTTVNVQVNTLPIVSANGSSVCAGTNAGLFATGGVSYSWTGPNGYSASGQNPILTNAALNQIGQYTVMVTDANTCTNVAVASILVSPIPSPSITGNGVACLNQPITLIASGGVTYQWGGPANFSSTASTVTLNTNNVALSGVYSVTVTGGNNCRAVAVTNVTVLPLPAVIINSDKRGGCVPVCINFTCTSNTPLQSYSWGMGNGVPFPISSSTATSCFNSAGVFSISTLVTDNNGCSNSGTYTVEAYPKPNADYVYASTKPIANVSGDVSFTDLSSEAVIANWNWDFMNNGVHTSTQQNPVFIYQDAGEYLATLIVTSNRGCKDTVIKSIVVGDDFGIWIPNTFTPDASSLNDVFQPKGFGILKYEITIYDRWGEKLYSGNDFMQGWDGTYNSQPCKQDTYVYRIVLTNVYNKSLEYVGHVNLLR